MADPFRQRQIREQNAEPMKQFYVQSNADANRESINQLKNNIELVFKGLSFAGQFLFFPFRVLKWQCQIHSESQRFHLTPFTIVPVIYNLKYQGYSSLWRGCFSFGAFCAFTNTIENVVGEITPLEKYQTDRPGRVFSNTLNKLITFSLTTPIYAAVVYESVQSGILNDALSISDLLKETWNRITGYRYSYRTRLIPFWSLIIPTSFYFAAQHITSICFENVFRQILTYSHKIFSDRRRIQAIDEIENEVVDIPYINAVASLSGQLTAVVILYPFETVLSRLIVQGTRTIIDNTDNGCGVIPINTRYEGFIDCLRMIEHTEGLLGFYKGVGVVVLELLFNFALLKLGKIAAYHLYDALWISKNDKTNFEYLTQQDYTTNQP